MTVTTDSPFTNPTALAELAAMQLRCAIECGDLDLLHSADDRRQAMQSLAFIAATGTDIDAAEARELIAMIRDLGS